MKFKEFNRINNIEKQELKKTTYSDFNNDDILQIPKLVKDTINNTYYLSTIPTFKIWFTRDKMKARNGNKHQYISRMYIQNGSDIHKTNKPKTLKEALTIIYTHIPRIR